MRLYSQLPLSSSRFHGRGCLAAHVQKPQKVVQPWIRCSDLAFHHSCSVPVHNPLEGVGTTVLEAFSDNLMVSGLSQACLSLSLRGLKAHFSGIKAIRWKWRFDLRAGCLCECDIRVVPHHRHHHHHHHHHRLDGLSNHVHTSPPDAACTMGCGPSNRGLHPLCSSRRQHINRPCFVMMRQSHRGVLRDHKRSWYRAEVNVRGDGASVACWRDPNHTRDLPLASCLLFDFVEGLQSSRPPTTFAIPQESARPLLFRKNQKTQRMRVQEVSRDRSRTCLSVRWRCSEVLQNKCFGGLSVAKTRKYWTLTTSWSPDMQVFYLTTHFCVRILTYHWGQNYYIT